MMIRIKGIRLNIKPIIVLPMILILLFVCMPVVPVSASSPPLLPGDTVTPVGGSSITVSGISDYLIWLTEHATAGLENKAEKWYQETFKGGSDICSSSNALNGRHNFVQQHTQVDGKTGTFYVCEYCGHSAGEVGEAAYHDYISDLPVSGLNSSGDLLFHVTWDDLDFSDNSYHSFSYWGGDVIDLRTIPTTSFVSTDAYDRYFVLRSDGLSTEIVSGIGNYGKFQFQFGIKFPVVGTYTPLDSVTCLGEYQGVYRTYTYSSLNSTSSFAVMDSSPVNVVFVAGNWSGRDGIGLPYTITFPVYKIHIPGSTLSLVSGMTYNDKTIYNVDSRPTSISGDLAYYNTNGDLMVAPSSTVVNETDNSVYNPVTNTSYDMSSWDYDYSTRTYNVNYQTTDASTGDVIDNSMSITYGDENISIVDGGTTYTVYYVTNYNGSGGDGGSGGNGGSDTPAPTAAPSGSVPIYDHDLPAGRSSFGQKLLAFFRDLPDLFADMTEFLKTGWEYIPDEITYFIEFGVAMAVLVGIFKLFFR